MAFGRFTAVKDLSLQVADGEFLAIVGPTGCGKSTVLNAVAGLLTPPPAPSPSRAIRSAASTGASATCSSRTR